MPMKTTFLVQTFEIHRKRLRPGMRDVAPTESGALKRAEAMAKRMPGTAALKIVADDETGELDSIRSSASSVRCRRTSPSRCAAAETQKAGRGERPGEGCASVRGNRRRR